MKICRFNDNRLGLVEGDEVLDVSQALDVLPVLRYPYPVQDQLVAHLPEVRARIASLAGSAARLPLASVQLLSPVANPGKIIAAPVNYVAHLKEVLADPNLHHDNQISHIERAGLFLKANSSLGGAAAGITLVLPERRTDHEIELVAVIGRTARHVAAADALAYVAGYSIGLDITIRGPEERSLRKSPDSYTVLGPWLTTADEIADPGQLALELLINGQPRQKTNTSQLILGVQALIEFASRFYTLHPGDLIFTGTPEGVSQIQAGDRFQARIAGLGELQAGVKPPLAE
ncbi:MAG: fumarylacetoacetate hydrolase family protein [Polaromonas sp.]|nr:fumarylacetoacetate hydrolase family protein [Polaromonas sp.]